MVRGRYHGPRPVDVVLRPGNEVEERAKTKDTGDMGVGRTGIVRTTAPGCNERLDLEDLCKDPMYS